MARKKKDASASPACEAGDDAGGDSTGDRVSLNPFEGKKGFYNRFNNLVYFFTGPAQVGIGRPEAPYVPPANPSCPVCGEPMADHEIDRSGERTQLHCPG